MRLVGNMDFTESTSMHACYVYVGPITFELHHGYQHTYFSYKKWKRSPDLIDDYIVNNNFKIKYPYFHFLTAAECYNHEKCLSSTGNKLLFELF